MAKTLHFSANSGKTSAKKWTWVLFGVSSNCLNIFEIRTVVFENRSCFGYNTNTHNFTNFDIKWFRMTWNVGKALIEQIWFSFEKRGLSREVVEWRQIFTFVWEIFILKNDWFFSKMHDIYSFGLRLTYWSTLKAGLWKTNHGKHNIVFMHNIFLASISFYIISNHDIVILRHSIQNEKTYFRKFRY